MTFENEERYRRKPDIVQALRLTAEGNVPITHADTAWLKKARADNRLSYRPPTVNTDSTGQFVIGQRASNSGQWFANTGNSLQAAYPGDWLVHHDADGRVEVLIDESFRARFEAIPFAEDE